MDEATLPDILDYENPIGMMFDRRAMLRWTEPIHFVDGLEYSLAIEDPSPVFSNAAGNYEAALPDLVGRLRYEHERFHFQVAGFASRGEFVPDVGQASDDGRVGYKLDGKYQSVWSRPDHFAVLMGRRNGRIQRLSKIWSIPRWQSSCHSLEERNDHVPTPLERHLSVFVGVRKCGCGERDTNWCGSKEY